MEDVEPGVFRSGLPEQLIEVAIKTSCPINGIVLDYLNNMLV